MKYQKMTLRQGLESKRLHAQALRAQSAEDYLLVLTKISECDLPSNVVEYLTFVARKSAEVKIGVSNVKAVGRQFINSARAAARAGRAIRSVTRALLDLGRRLR